MFSLLTEMYISLTDLNVWFFFRLISQFDLAEQKKDDDLEKIRLRNISLRQQLRKLERTLRAREQLAEVIRPS